MIPSNGATDCDMRNKNERPNRQRLGRPPKPRDEVRSERVVSFVTRGEFDALAELANDRGESISAVIHQILSSRFVEEE